jgi:sarcosine oxidase
MGSAATDHLARRGARVLGLDRFAPPHAMGSSHGDTRIIREAYFEDPRYVPMVQRAYELWRELEARSGRRLLIETGGLMLGREDGVVVRGARASAEAHHLPHELLGSAEVRRRFPAFTPGPELVAVWEPRAGVLFPEACVGAHLASATRAGAELRSDEPVTDWRPDGAGFEVLTDKSRYRAGQLVLAANAWLEPLLAGARLGLTVTRQVLFWFQPRGDADRFEPERFPIYICEPEPNQFFYGFPAFGGEIKVAPHGGGPASDPDALDRVVRDTEVDAMRARLAALLPQANGRFARAAVCMYASTPDAHFVMDRHPEHPGVLVLSACSGHGFKFSSAIGEIAADLVLEGRTSLDLGPFRWRSPRAAERPA